jgi:hypothetical protein
MRLACQRQQRPEEAEKYALMRDEAMEKAQAFREEIDAWRKEELARSRAERLARFASWKRE